MSKKKSARYGRDAPREAGTAKRAERSAEQSAFLVSQDQWKIFINDGYRPLNECPEVQMCVNIYADLIGSMTVHLMENAEKGDIRIRDELARKMDVNPCSTMTRSTYTDWLVRTMLTEGNTVVIPHYRDEYLQDLEPVEHSRVSFRKKTGMSYSVIIDGQEIDPDTVLHYVFKPSLSEPFRGAGVTASLRDIVKSIRQSEATRKALLESPAPSIIVKVDGLTEEFASKDGRRKLKEEYIDSSENGQPWFIPAEAFSVETVKPLTLNDLAIRPNLELDKRAVAGLFGVPAFMVGVGEFRKEEFQHFLSTRVANIAHIIEQEDTKKLLWSPKRYFRLNSRSLYNYSMDELINAGSAMVDRMAMRRNEWRDWLGMPPDADMEELLALENYLPADRLGDQKKLYGGGEQTTVPDEGGEDQ